MPLTYSQHAIDRMNERGIPTVFVEATVNAGGFVLQAHGTRLYSAPYSYQVLVPVPIQQPILNQFGQQLFDHNWNPMFQWVMVNMLNTVSYTVTVITDGTGTHVVTVWWN